jgi:hypothetical protein
MRAVAQRQAESNVSKDAKVSPLSLFSFFSAH